MCFVMPKAEYVLGKQYTTSVLLYLLEREEKFKEKKENGEIDEDEEFEVTTSEFRDISGHYKGPVNRAEELEDLGLVKIEYQKKPFRKGNFMLTEEGKEIAEKLKEIEEEIGEVRDN